MTKQEAIRAMRETHRWFSPNEWMTIKAGNILLLEDECTCFIDEFFSYRTDPSWEDGYSLFE